MLKCKRKFRRPKVKVFWDVITPWRLQSHGRFGRRQRLYLLFFLLFGLEYEGIVLLRNAGKEFIGQHDVTFQKISKFFKTTLRTSILAQIEFVSWNARHSQNLRSFLTETEWKTHPTSLRVSPWHYASFCVA